MRQAGTTPVHVDLRRYLRETDEDRDLTRVICEIADASISMARRNWLSTSSPTGSSANA